MIENINAAELTSDERKETIVLITNGSFIGVEYDILLNECIVEESMLALNKKGAKVNAKSGKQDKNYMAGACHGNSADMMRKGYGYVEGFITLKEEKGAKVAHAWNVDKKGNHIDFTLEDAERWDYFGLIIPNKIVYEVGAKRGHIWHCVIPFMDEVPFE